MDTDAFKRKNACVMYKDMCCCGDYKFHDYFSNSKYI